MNIKLTSPFLVLGFVSNRAMHVTQLLSTDLNFNLGTFMDTLDMFLEP